MVYESVNHCEIVVDLLNTLRTPKYARIFLATLFL